MSPAEFVPAVVMHFPVRHESPEREIEWMRSIIDAIKNYDGQVLERAAKIIIETRTDRRFPLPAEIRKACTEAYDEMRRQKLIPQQEAPKSSADAWSSDRQRLAYDLCKTEFGKKAARDGWALQLWDFCRNHGRLPTDEKTKKYTPMGSKFSGELLGEIEWCKREAKDFEAAYAHANRNSWSCQRVTIQLADQIFERRKRLEAAILGEAA